MEEDRNGWGRSGACLTGLMRGLRVQCVQIVSSSSYPSYPATDAHRDKVRWDAIRKAKPGQPSARPAAQAVGHEPLRLP